jgi:nucleoside 2-deoxyribosyltransferase
MIYIYLSGPILGCKKHLYNAWREKTINDLGHHKEISFLDPTSGELYENEAEYADEVVAAAIENVEKSDIVFAYIPFYSMGTSFEIFWANQLNKKIIVALEAEHESAFVRKFADYIFYNLEDAIDFLNKKNILMEIKNEENIDYRK